MWSMIKARRGIQLCLGMLGILAWTSAAPAQLVSHYKFDETSGATTTYEEVSGTDVSLTGDPNFLSGKVGNAVELDGDGDYFFAPVPSGLDSSELTVAFWTRVSDELTPQGWEKADFTSWWSAVEFTEEARMALEVHGYDPDNGPYLWEKEWPGATQFTGSTDLVAAYHHVALTLSASTNAAKIYVDGVEEGSAAWGSTTAIDEMTIGARRKWASTGAPVAFEFVGQIDDMQIYDQALSTPDIESLYDDPGSIFEAMLTGDFDGDGEITPADVDMLWPLFGTSVPPADAMFDLSEDDQVTFADASELVENIVGTSMADADLNKEVDILDLGTLANAYGDPGVFSDCDTDGNGQIDILDLGTLANDYGKSFNASGSAVPEPVSLTLLGVAGLTLLRRPRRLN